MSNVTHRRVSVNGVGIHIAEKGKGPLVLLLHGFPELWSSWNYQIKHLAEHGYHVVAPDLRGYGDSDCPLDPALYTVFHIVGDLIGIIDEVGEKQAFVVGHDWGAEIAWHLCLFRPDRVKALVNLGVPYRGRPPVKPIEVLVKLFGEGFYISQFLEPNRAEKSFSKYNCFTILKKFLQIDGPDLLAAPPGVEIIDFLPTPTSLPPWITEEELLIHAAKFEKTGFTGALNYYRAMNVSWEFTGPWQGAKINVPTKFIAGNQDIGWESYGTKHYIAGEDFRRLVPNLEVVVIDGQHCIHQERAKLVTEEILAFFNDYRAHA